MERKFFEAINVWMAKAVKFCLRHPILTVVATLLLLSKEGRAIATILAMFGMPLIIIFKAIPFIKKKGLEKKALVITIVILVLISLPIWQSILLLSAGGFWWFKTGRFLVHSNELPDSEKKEKEKEVVDEK